MKSYTAFILILLGLFFKISATSVENTTKTYFVELDIENGAFKNFEELLKKLQVVNDENYTASVTNINITADCLELNGTFIDCTCAKGNRWSEQILKEYPNCYNKTSCVIEPLKVNVVCQSVNRVLVNGSFNIPRSDIYFLDPTTYKELDKNLTRELTAIYSTLTWFDSLIITELSLGSINGKFAMLLNSAIDAVTLENLTITLQLQINATFNLVTVGFIKISEHELIASNETVNITCNTPVELGNATWYIERSGYDKQAITNGMEAGVHQFPKTSTVSITKTSEAWKGTFTCEFKSKKLPTIIHRASVALDVAILPEIFIISYPQFPNCKHKPKDVVPVTTVCIIKNSTEPYVITWTKAGGSQVPTIGSRAGALYYNGKTSIDCTLTVETYKVTCEFKNRKDQMSSASLDIPIITNNSVVCTEDSEWPEAKANSTAIKLCNSAADVGLIERSCNETGKYGQIISKCVDVQLQGLLNIAMDLQRGIGLIGQDAVNVFSILKQSTETTVTTTFANINISVQIMNNMQNASKIQQSKWNDTTLIDIVKSSSNLLNDSLLQTWNTYVDVAHPDNLAITYLKTFEEVLNQTNVTSPNLNIQQQNVQTTTCNKTQGCRNIFNVSITKVPSQNIFQTSFKNLARLLPKTLKGSGIITNGIVFSVMLQANNPQTSDISMQFQTNRLPNHDMYCVFFDIEKKMWSDNGCTWGGVSNPNLCTCDHLTPFTILMSATPIQLLYMDELTYIGLGFSVCSLTLCLVIEFLVWNTVVKSNISHFRHTVMVNINICLLIGHCSFLANVSESITQQWCLILTVLKHYCFLAAFSWMLCLSVGILHQVVLVFVHLRKKVYLGLCFSLGYLCPFIIVTVTIITYDSGAVDSYYSAKTCWLKYEKLLQGSIHAFILPAGVIVFVNMFTMVLVISKIVKSNMSELKTHDDKEIVKSIIKTVIILTPALGVTWVLGFFVLILDLSERPWADMANYAFTILNSFQGFFLLLTGCLLEKKHSTKMKNERSISKATTGKKK